MYTTKLWRSVEKHILERGFYENVASITLVPNSLWPKVKPFVYIMSRYLTHIKSGLGSNLNLSQFVTLRFLNYLIYNAYVLHRVIAVEDILDGRRKESNRYVQILVPFHRARKSVSLRGFVADIKSYIRLNGSSSLFPDAFGIRIPVVAGADGQEANGELYLGPVQWKPLPKQTGAR